MNQLLSNRKVKDGMILGLGTGSTAYYMIKKVGDLINKIDLCIDGVDEIDKEFNAIKGGGDALFREKIVASMAKKVIWIMDSSKLVKNIGKFPLPIEVLPYGYTWDQEGEPPYYDIVMNELNKSLYHASFAYIKYIIDNNMILLPHKWIKEAFSYLKNYINNLII